MLSSHLPTLIITGASGLIGKYLLDELKNDFRIFAIARRSQQECNAPKHPNIAWLRADISKINSISKIFREIKTAGGADYLIHLAAYYEFINDNHPEYELTNVNGTKNILDLSKELNLKLFVFTSSVAACSFPKPGSYIDENSPPDGLHPYAVSKRLGEELVKNFSKETKACIVRLGAVYSDWCEYPPLFMFLNTWLGKSWRSRVLGGKGSSAIPYIHIRDLLSFFKHLLYEYNKVPSGEILIASTEGSTSHAELYRLATKYFYGREFRPFQMPKIFCAIGIYAMKYIKQLLGMENFESPWMIKYIDKKLNVRISKTFDIINWRPNPRFSIEKRFPFMIERMKSESVNWQLRNILILRKTSARVDFCIYSVLAEEEEKIVENILTFIKGNSEINSYKHINSVNPIDLEWFVKLILRLILSSINTNNKLLIQNYFEVSGINRFEAGYELIELNYLLKTINSEIIKHLKKFKQLQKFEKEFYFYITLPIEFGIDEAEQQFESFTNKSETDKHKQETVLTDDQNLSRKLLEETIWSCLVNRK